jgi:cbb3-type cytochrome oxidase maturation protein
MNILFLMVPMALGLGALFIYGFFWAVSNGQMDDLETPALRILNDDLVTSKKQHRKELK